MVNNENGVFTITPDGEGISYNFSGTKSAWAGAVLCAQTILVKAMKADPGLDLGALLDEEIEAPFQMDAEVERDDDGDMSSHLNFPDGVSAVKGCAHLLNFAVAMDGGE